MKSVLKSVFVVALLSVTSIAFSQTGEKKKFNHIELKELRKTVINQLIKDDLIEKRNDKVYLSLRDSKTLLNGEVLDTKLHNKYETLLKSFDIGRGAYRGIYLDNKCTAVGDFYKDSIRGKVKGRFNTKEFKSSEI